MDLDAIAARMSELGHPTRLSIFKYLVKVGNTGLTVGDIQDELQIPGSTLSHHLSRLVRVGLIRQVRESRTLYCFPEFDTINEIIGFLSEECCSRDNKSQSCD